MQVHYDICRVLAFILFVIAAVLAVFVDEVTVHTLIAIIASGLAAWVLA